MIFKASMNHIIYLFQSTFKANKIVFIHVHVRVYLHKAMAIQTQKSRIMIAIDRFETLYIVRSYSIYKHFWKSNQICQKFLFNFFTSLCISTIFYMINNYTQDTWWRTERLRAYLTLVMLYAPPRRRIHNKMLNMQF